MGCLVCGDAKIVAKDRCPTCYEYARRHGNDRSDQLIEQLTRRDIEREADRRRANRR